VSQQNVERFGARALAKEWGEVSPDRSFEQPTVLSCRQATCCRIFLQMAVSTRYTP
jgi:hypothetical protein